ncbi:uncharacterized protein BDV14DRAFT_182242 [Aspergillus stella-maris]|uniref:uncharacterized protein n=1 Tax=Aspergillus stella-maris TaxID=1810926 RepID=UPI003CCD06F3
MSSFANCRQVIIIGRLQELVLLCCLEPPGKSFRRARSLWMSAVVFRDQGRGVNKVTRRVPRILPNSPCLP